MYLDPQDMATDDGEEMGRLTQQLHSGESSVLTAHLSLHNSPQSLLLNISPHNPPQSSLPTSVLTTHLSSHDPPQSSLLASVVTTHLSPHYSTSVLTIHLSLHYSTSALTTQPQSSQVTSVLTTHLSPHYPPWSSLPTLVLATPPRSSLLHLHPHYTSGLTTPPQSSQPTSVYASMYDLHFLKCSKSC